MDEGELNINAELAQLIEDGEAELRKERRQTPYYTVSLEEEHTALVSAFHEEQARQLLTDELTVDMLLGGELALREGGAADDEEDFPDNRIYQALHDRVAAELEKYPVLLSGEMQLGGEAVFVCLPKPEDVDRADEYVGYYFLSDGETLMGDIAYYSVDAAPLYRDVMQRLQAEEDNEDIEGTSSPEEPGIWLHLRNTVMHDQSGFEVDISEDVAVLLTHAGVHLHKVERLGGSNTLPEMPNRPVEVTSQFKHTLSDSFSDMENALNYCDLTHEEFSALRADIQEELATCMESVVSEDASYIVFAHMARGLDNGVVELAGQSVAFLQSTMMKVGTQWRVAHAFQIDSPENGTQVVHVLPEDIIRIDMELE